MGKPIDKEWVDKNLWADEDRSHEYVCAFDVAKAVVEWGEKTNQQGAGTQHWAFLGGVLDFIKQGIGPEAAYKIEQPTRLGMCYRTKETK